MSSKSKTKQKRVFVAATAVYLKLLMNDEGVMATHQETDGNALEECMGTNPLLSSGPKSGG